MTKKRFVTYSSWNMGVESSWEDEKGNERPFWIVYDKDKGRSLSYMEAERKDAIKTANKFNEKWSKGTLIDTEITYHDDEN